MLLTVQNKLVLVFYKEACQLLLPHCWNMTNRIICVLRGFNSLRLRENGNHFVDDIFKCIFLYKSIWISYQVAVSCTDLSLFIHVADVFQFSAALDGMGADIFEDCLCVFHHCYQTEVFIEDNGISHDPFNSAAVWNSRSHWNWWYWQINRKFDRVHIYITDFNFLI